MHGNCLIIFTRYPEAGKAKTRLIPALGADGAANLHRQFTEQTLQKALTLLDTAIAVHFTGGSLEQMQTWLGGEVQYRSQTAGDLGDRMSHAFMTTFAEGYQSVIIIGTDCPQLTPELLSQAFQALLTHDLVLGATTDGGYYLLGLRQPMPELFVDVAWSTEVVFQQTIAIAQQLGLAIAQLPTLSDVDRPEDLRFLQHFGMT
jgi:uncharacterized protein